MTRLSTGLAGLAALAVAAGCGAASVPAGQVTDTKAAIRGAEEVGAAQHPRAALHLKMARDQVKTAEALIANDENEQARLVLERAEADAELAVALAKEARLQSQARQAMQRIERLKQETE